MLRCLLAVMVFPGFLWLAAAQSAPPIHNEILIKNAVVMTVTHGTNTILGLDPERILEVPALLQRELLRRCPPLWDGCAGERAADAIERVAARAAHAPIPVIREPALCVA